MGAGASFQDLPERISKEMCQSIVGEDQFNSERFDLMKDETDGCISKKYFMQMAQHKYDVFLTHNWAEDEKGRSNHDRVAKINEGLKRKGLVTWFDSDRMQGNIADKMSEGISDSQCVLVFITQTYLDKVGGQNDQDNCKLEFGFTARNKGAALMVPVVMEERVRVSNKWKGQVGLVLGGSLYQDCAADGDEENDAKIDQLVQSVLSCVKQAAEGSAYQPPPPPAASSSASAASSATVSTPKSSNNQPASSITIAASNEPCKPLADLSINDVQNLLDNLSLSKCKASFLENEVNGMLLCACTTAEEIKELGVPLLPKAKVLHAHISAWESGAGVPLSKLKPVKAAAAVTEQPAAKPAAQVAVTKEPSSPPKIHIDYPKKIVMAGLPFAHQGWNGTYTMKNGATKNGFPIWRNPPHNLLLLSIIGADIYFDGQSKQWMLHRDGDNQSKGMHYGPSGESPLGDWDGNITVTRG